MEIARTGRGRPGVLPVIVTGALVLAWAVAALRAETAVDVESILAAWPPDAQAAARGMISRHGEPRRSDLDSLTWIGPKPWLRTILRRGDSAVLEQTVLYRVPASKVSELAAFDDRISFDPEAGELTVSTGGENTNFLLANYAHEIASGYATLDQARSGMMKALRLSLAGKSSSYLETLRFEQKARRLAAPMVLPAGVNKPSSGGE